MVLQENTVAKIELLLDQELQKRGIVRESLRYAERQGLGYRIIPGKMKQAKIWETLVGAVHDQLPEVTKGQLADQIFLFIHG